MTTTAIKERPILFSGPMVRAILAGKKTQTRRVIKSFKSFAAGEGCELDCIKDCDGGPSRLDMAPDNWEICPYGVPGERLWVRETFCPSPNDDPTFCGFYAATDSARNVKWKPSIFMPRSVCRIVLEVTGVRVERVQEITAGDAELEGFGTGELNACDGECAETPCGVAVGCFRTLWEKLNGPRGYGWDVNPWVWVVSFKRI